MPQNQK